MVGVRYDPASMVGKNAFTCPPPGAPGVAKNETVDWTRATVKLECRAGCEAAPRAGLRVVDGMHAAAPLDGLHMHLDIGSFDVRVERKKEKKVPPVVVDPPRVAAPSVRRCKLDPNLKAPSFKL